MATTTPSIPEWFRNRNILVSGATGFMGKVLISKLLTSCPDLGNIFLLVREKKGIDPQSRLQVILEQEPFKILRNNHRERLKKLIVISGDTSKESLGISDSDKKRLINEVSVVFHMAANVRFDLPLKTAVNWNTKGTINILAFAKQMPHIESFIHVSTAYCQCGEKILEERAYPTLLSPENIITTTDTMTDSVLDAMTSKILGDQPNTYAFSKALCEDLVARCGLPAGVARPSIVTASWKEPVPGWIENLNGATGLIIGAGKGVIRSMLCNSDYLSDLIPCDLAINAIIALAWRVGLEKSAQPIFMNVTESGENPISWGTALESGKRHVMSNPFSGLMWYPGGRLTASKILHWFAVIFFHLLPAYFLDTIFILTGNKPFLIKVQNRVASGLEMLQYYTTKEWVFRNDTMKDLQHRLCLSDKETFFMDTKAICWDEYLLHYILGCRKYCLKEDPSTLPRSRQVLKYLHIADCCVKLLSAMFIIWCIYSWIIPIRATATMLIGAKETNTD